MIVLAVGMPRAGSGWHYNLVHDLMLTAGSVDSRRIREQYRLKGILTEVNCNIGVLSARRLALLLRPALMGKTFVIKAHAAPTDAARWMMRARVLRVTYIYRDPRDAMLSAYEYGRRALEKGRPNAFSHLTDFSASLEFMKHYVRTWEMWSRVRGVHSVRYENLLSNYEGEASRLAEFLGLRASDPEVNAVIENYRPGIAQGQQGLHYYKGQVGRFREAFSVEQQLQLQKAFGSALARMQGEL